MNACEVMKTAMPTTSPLLDDKAQVAIGVAVAAAALIVFLSIAATVLAFCRKRRQKCLMCSNLNCFCCRLIGQKICCGRFGTCSWY